MKVKVWFKDGSTADIECEDVLASEGSLLLSPNYIFAQGHWLAVKMLEDE